jgi:two-component system phosphate regulon response regulator PhoB
MGPRILFIEDELNLLQSLSYILEKEGFQVRGTPSGVEGAALAAQDPPDLVLLDLNLPDIDGFEVCRRLKANPATRGAFIMMLSGRGDLEDVVAGLTAYADDYLTKPFQPKLLLARIHALLRRRSQGTPPAPPAQHGLLRLDAAAREVWVEGQKVALTKTEFEILHLLASRPGRVLTRDQILDHIRGIDYAITDRVVDYQVSGLRKKLGAAAEYLETVRGVGYKFVGPAAGAGDAQ